MLALGKSVHPVMEVNLLGLSLTPGTMTPDGQFSAVKSPLTMSGFCAVATAVRETKKAVISQRMFIKFSALRTEHNGKIILPDWIVRFMTLRQSCCRASAAG
jgi:hypothetical protein